MNGYRNLFKPVVLACVFLLLLAFATFFNIVPGFVLILYGVISLLTFVVYALDKSAARKGRWRTSENTLHLLAIMGGWPGAVLAQQKLRHKSSKKSFRLVFWTTVMLNMALLYWLCTPLGRQQLDDIFSLLV